MVHRASYDKEMRLGGRYRVGLYTYGVRDEELRWCVFAYPSPGEEWFTDYEKALAAYERVIREVTVMAAMEALHGVTLQS